MIGNYIYVMQKENKRLSELFSYKSVNGNIEYPRTIVEWNNWWSNLCDISDKARKHRNTTAHAGTSPTRENVEEMRHILFDMNGILRCLLDINRIYEGRGH